MKFILKTKLHRAYTVHHYAVRQSAALVRPLNFHRDNREQNQLIKVSEVRVEPIHRSSLPISPTVRNKWSDPSDLKLNRDAFER